MLMPMAVSSAARADEMGGGAYPRFSAAHAAYWGDSRKDGERYSSSRWPYAHAATGSKVRDVMGGGAAE